MFETIGIVCLIVIVGRVLFAWFEGDSKPLPRSNAKPYRDGHPPNWPFDR